MVMVTTGQQSFFFRLDKHQSSDDISPTLTFMLVVIRVVKKCSFRIMFCMARFDDSLPTMCTDTVIPTLWINPLDNFPSLSSCSLSPWGQLTSLPSFHCLVTAWMCHSFSDFGGSCPLKHSEIFAVPKPYQHARFSPGPMLTPPPRHGGDIPGRINVGT